jgi:hypothetical protein
MLGAQGQSISTWASLGTRSNMTTLNVSFTDATEAAINAYFGSPQDIDAWPYQGQIATSDARWEAYYDSLLTGQQKFVPAPGS